MAETRVIVERLASIENFGSMDVRCSTDRHTDAGQGRPSLRPRIEGEASQKVLLYACLNAFYETGFADPIDEALRASNSLISPAMRSWPRCLRFPAQAPEHPAGQPRPRAP